MDKQESIEKILALICSAAVGEFPEPLSLARFETQDEMGPVTTATIMLCEELREKSLSLDYFDHLFNKCGELLFILNTSGVIAEVNASALERLGYRKDQVVGAHWNDLLPPGQESGYWNNGQIVPSGETALEFSSGPNVKIRFTSSSLPIGWGHYRETLIVANTIEIPSSPAIELTPKEYELLQFISQGYTNGQIGDMTYRSKRTVDSQRGKLYQKFGVKKVANLLLIANQLGMIQNYPNRKL